MSRRGDVAWPGPVSGALRYGVVSARSGLRTRADGHISVLDVVPDAMDWLLEQAAVPGE